MRTLQLLLMMIGALAVLALSVAAAPSLAANAPSPCHATADGSAPTHDSAPMNAMNCCIACVAAPVIEPPTNPARVAVASVETPVALDLPLGRSPCPEPGPPKG